MAPGLSGQSSAVPRHALQLGAFMAVGLVLGALIAGIGSDSKFMSYLPGQVRALAAGVVYAQGTAPAASRRRSVVVVGGGGACGSFMLRSQLQAKRMQAARPRMRALVAAGARACERGRTAPRSQPCAARGVPSPRPLPLPLTLRPGPAPRAPRPPTPPSQLAGQNHTMRVISTEVQQIVDQVNSLVAQEEKIKAMADNVQQLITHKDAITRDVQAMATEVKQIATKQAEQGTQVVEAVKAAVATPAPAAAAQAAPAEP